MSVPTAPSPALPRQRWFLVALCLFFLVINVQYVLKMVSSERSTRSAFQRWTVSLIHLGTGEDIWARYNYPNPPIMALILRPLASLPPMAGALAWFYLKVAMAVLALQWVLRLLDHPDRPFPWWGKVLAVLLSLRPIEGDLVHGNVNLFILFLVVGALVAFCRRRDVLAGLLLALAIACKVTPALFVPYFLWKRAWKTLLGTAAGLGLFVWVIPGLLLGWGENEQYLQSWWKNMITPYAVEGKITSEHVNQSLPGLLERMLTHSPSFITYVDDILTPVEYHNVVELDERVVPWIVKGCMGLFVLLVVWRCRTPAADRGSWRLVAEFAVVVLGMLLFSERTWKHHCVTLLLPFAVLAYCASALCWPARTRWYVIGSLAAAFVLIMLTSTGLSAGQDRFGELAQVYGAYVWAYVVLLSGLLVVLGRGPEAARATAESAPPDR
jgi:hypothetical protein